jgi:hypothetical protein
LPLIPPLPCPLQAGRYTNLIALGLPVLTDYYVVGILWVFALSFLMHGLIMTGMATLSYHVLLLFTRGTSPRRVGGVKEQLRDLKVRAKILG